MAARQKGVNGVEPLFVYDKNRITTITLQIRTAIPARVMSASSYPVRQREIHKEIEGETRLERVY